MPVWLYRLRLGFLLGNRFLLLTHIGRKSGLPRQTVLEVLRYDSATNVCVIASGWGETSDWLRNIRKTPEVRITIGLRQFAAKAVRLSLEEAQQELLDFARRHPVAFRGLAARKLPSVPQEEAETCRSLAPIIPLFALRIYRLIKDRGLTQTEAGNILGTKQPNVSALMRNRSGTFSVERLIDFLTALGQDVEITVKPTRKEHGEVSVAL